MIRTSKRKPMPTRAQLRKLLFYDSKTGQLHGLKKGNHSKGNKQKLGDLYYIKSNLAWVYVHGKIPDTKYVSFIDRNTKNLAIDNLRLVVVSERSQGAKMHNTNRTGVRGVCYDTNRNKWVGFICKDGIRYGGRFDTMIQAIKWRQNKEQELFTILPR